MGFRPLEDNVLIQRDPAAAFVGSIIIPESARERTQRGTVLAVGPGKLRMSDGERMPLQVNVGDRVLIPKFHGHGDMDHLLGKKNVNQVIISEGEILAVIEDEHEVANVTWSDDSAWED